MENEISRKVDCYEKQQTSVLQHVGLLSNAAFRLIFKLAWMGYKKHTEQQTVFHF